MDSNIKIYKEVSINNEAQENSYKDPMTKVYQYEYALLMVLTQMFRTITCKSMCLERLKLYFLELPHNNPNKPSNMKTAESITSEIKKLVERDITGKIRFPNMHMCRAQLKIYESKDGSHIFIFTDGMYGFGIRLVQQGRRKNLAIEVIDIADKAA